MENNLALLQYTIGILNKSYIRHEVHSFPSEAIILDIWCENKFYVLQFENDFLGFSEVDENVGFDATPDEKFMKKWGSRQNWN